MSTYILCKRMIQRERYSSKEDMQFKLDVFFAGDRLNKENYEELTQLLNG